MEKKKKNGSHRHDINRPRSTHGHKYRKYKKCLIMIMLICTKEDLSNIWGSIHENIKQHWGWVKEKNVAYKKERVYISLSICPSESVKSLSPRNCPST